MLHAAEAYEAASAPFIVGASVIATALVEQVAATAHTPELVHAVDFARKSVHIADGTRREALARLQALIGTTSAPDATTFDAWSRELHATVTSRASGDSAHAAELGAIVGELYLATWTARTLIYLRTADPTSAVIARQAASIDHRVDALRTTLAAALARPELRGVSVPGESLLALVTRPRAAAAATTVADYKAYFEWASQIWSLVGVFGAMLARLVDPLAPIFAEILAHPDDDAPRLRYAELAGGDHAEFIRQGIALRDLRRKGLYGQYVLPTKAKLAALVKRHPEWGLELLPLVDSLDFGRGFVERVTLPAAGFLERAPKIFASAPVLHAQLTQAHGKVAALASSPHLEHLRSLDLSLNHLDDADAIALASSPHLRKLRWLELKQNRIGEAGLDALAAATRDRFPALGYLGIAINQCADPTDETIQDDSGSFSYRPREAGHALEAKYGELRWLHFHSEMLPDPDAVP